jgi:diguanylate cyclase (GGDEF)-like protein
VVSDEMVIEIGNSLLIARDGTERPVDDSAAPIRDSAGTIIGVVVAFRDVGARKQVEEQLHYAATHDSLTGLPNRTLLLERLTRVLEYSRRHPEHKFAVLLLDLDHFKLINDNLGHLLGDQVLTTVARRLEKELRSPDTVARFGGDEFVILLDGFAHVRDALLVAERIQKRLKEPIKVRAHDVSTAASIGIVLSGTDYAQPDEILHDADAALYRAKATGKGHNVVFDADLNELAVSSLRLDSDLRRAVEHEEFLFYYQPIVSLEDERVRGLEALLRWQHPERGLLLPGEFLESAEENGLLNEIGERLLRRACQQALAWKDLRGRDQPIPISVNMSTRQFGQPDLVEQVAQALTDTGLDPQCLCLEFREDVLSDQEATNRTLTHLHDLGVQLYVDDFGTGYSSLRVLDRAPIDILKIDRPFVQRLSTGGRDESSVVRAIMRLARELKMDVIAEGIDTAEQAAHLRTLGCNYGQGHWFLEPLDADGVTANIRKRSMGF